jgi:iron only hydrogenase large subunit-like protein
LCFLRYPPPPLQDPDKSEPLPMFTSCCPGWVAMVEKSNPELIPYLSSCKSPQMMLGAVIKNYFAEVGGVTAEVCLLAQSTRGLRPSLS